MNDELQKAVSELLSKTIGGIDKAGSFLSGEIPSYIQELLMWKAAYSAIFCLIGVILVVLAAIWGERLLKKQAAWVMAGKSYESRELSFAVTFFAGVIYFIVALEVLNLTWLKIWLAPRVYLVEYMASLAS